MQREGLFTRAGQIGGYLRQRLGALQQKHEVIGDLRGRGLYAGLEFVADRASRAPFPETARFTHRLGRLMRERGVIVGGGVAGAGYGRGGGHTQISPPLAVATTEIGALAGTLDDVLSAIRLDPNAPSIQ